MPSPYALIFSAIMVLKKGVLFSVVIFSALLGISDSGVGDWIFSWPKSGEVVDSSSSSEPQTPPTPYKYPTPQFIEENITVMANLTGNNTIIEWIKEHPWIYGVIGGTALIVGALMVAIITICCWYCCKRKRSREYHPELSPEDGRSKSTSKEQPKNSRKKDQASTEERRKQREIEEKKTAVEAAKGFLMANSTEYLTQPDEAGNLSKDFKQPDMGSRMQKYWFMVEPLPTSQSQTPQYAQLIVTAAPVSQKCPLKLDENMLRGANKLIAALKPHPYLHKILKIDYRYDTKQVIIVQPYMTNGSLKDMIYKVSPTTDWSRKYSRRSKGLPTVKVQRYGRQILEAVLFLYSKEFPMLGHVQSGNIFVDDKDVCHLGGYENTLLGYKTRLYRLCRNYLQHFDVIMFGHLIFEMSCGYELTHLRPEQDEYSGVKDQDVKEVLQYIFRDGFPNTIEQIREHHFFSVELEAQGFDPHTIEISDHMKKVIRKVRKAKPREQPTEQPTPGLAGKIKQVLTKTDKKESEPQQQQPSSSQPQGASSGSTEVTVHHGSTSSQERKGSFSFKLPWKKGGDKEGAPDEETLLTDGGDPKEPKESTS